MTSEYKKIDNEYLENNGRRDFGLTSWAHTDELFPWEETPMKKINNELSIIDWEKLGWESGITSIPCPHVTSQVIHPSNP
jgi:hypothetical protein